MNNTLEEIAEKLNSGKSLAIFCHSRPDGDTLGAGLALYLALKNAGKTAYIFCEDAPPEKFAFLPVMKDVSKELPDCVFDTCISVDCADVARMGCFSKFYKRFRGVTVNIDHHVSNEGYAKYNYVRECPATCAIMTDLFTEAGIVITKEIADLLMLGLITDSGNFVHCDVTGETFRTAAKLRDCGADVNGINYNMYSRQTKPRALLYGRVIGGIRFELDDRLAVILITSDDFEATGSDQSVTEGFVDYGLTVDGVEVSISVMEYKEGQYKASLRSKGKVNVNAIASEFGGGGHILASGCMLFGTAENVVGRLIEAVGRAL